MKFVFFLLVTIVATAAAGGETSSSSTGGNNGGGGPGTVNISTCLDIIDKKLDVLYNLTRGLHVDENTWIQIGSITIIHNENTDGHPVSSSASFPPLAVGTIVGILFSLVHY